MDTNEESHLAALGIRLEVAVERVVRHRRRRRAVVVGGTAIAVGVPLTRLAALGLQPARATPSTPSPAGGSEPSHRESPSKPTTTVASTATTRPAPPRGEIADPSSLIVLVDRHRWLPAGWVPPDLVEPNVAFNFAAPHEKRLLRREAAVALEDLVEAAARDGVAIRGASGYRSERTQADVWDAARAREGEAAAARAVAQPGHSEHQTGLAIDITDHTDACLLNQCFAATPAGRWVDANAPRFGYLVRYPFGAESITGYKYEPWHLRYVGDVAVTVAAHGRTLDQYLGAT